LWQELRGTVGYPWFRRTYALAVEPHSTVPEGGPPSIVFEGGQRRESTMTLTLSAC